MDNHVVLVNIENDTEQVRRQFSPPFGLLIAASVLIRHNIDVVVRHIINTPESKDELLKACEGAIAVGFSVMTSPNIISALEVSRLLHSKGIFIYWSGTHATLLPDIVLKDDCVDAVLRGEAESNLYGFILWRKGLLNADSVAGLCYRDKERVVVSPIPPPVDKSLLGYHPFELIDINKYLNKPIVKRKNYIPGNILPFMTSKGCVKRCAFCYNNVVNKSKWRPYALDQVYKEMDYLIDKYGITGWMFYDDNMFVDVDRAWKILERYRMPSSVELDLARVNETLIERAKKANVSKLYIGIESGSDEMLRKMHKGITVRDVRYKMDMCNNMGINVDLSFMILLPGETTSQLDATLSLIEELKEYPNIKIDGPKCYNPYPGTQFFDEEISLGWVMPQTNEEWAKFNRKISVDNTGFNLSDEYMKVIQKYNYI